jgi:hypothetical protein
MLQKKVNYVDYKRVQRSEVFFFNLSKAEVAEMELSHKGGLSEKIKRITESDTNEDEIVKIFKEVIIKSYGVVSDDGRRFIKSEQMRSEFEQSAAYSELFMQLATDAEAAAAFFNGIMPQITEIEKK